MKRKDLQDIKTKSVKDLKNKISDLEKQKTNSLLELKMGKVKNVHTVKKIKKDIAQVKTIARLKFLMEKNESEVKSAD